MNKTDRERLIRLNSLLHAVPFASQGLSGSSATTAGFVGFDQDMRAIRPYLGKVLEGMLLEGQEEMEEGWDYEDPDKLLDAMEAWIEKRSAEEWQGANEYSLRYFWKDWLG